MGVARAALKTGEARLRAKEEQRMPTLGKCQYQDWQASLGRASLRLCAPVDGADYEQRIAIRHDVNVSLWLHAR